MVRNQKAFDTFGYVSEATIMMDDSLYKYFVELIETRPSRQVLEKIRLLLVETKNYPDAEVLGMVKHLVYSPTAKVNCLSFFNRLCQICIAHWIVREETKSVVFDLLDLFKKLNIYQIQQQDFIARWQEESQNFSQTTEYLKLVRLIRITNPGQSSAAVKPKFLGDLLGRYPFLYKDCLLNSHSVQKYIDFSASFRRHQQRSLNKKLIKSIVLQKQKIEVARLRTLTTKVPQPIETVPNPTLLNNRVFNVAVETFSDDSRH
ncbi:hypothetical protein [Crocosphaera sp. Alani8]|uniref:hypothetical protein n=1 Tax=Crocosphaera sp. Alani8 TaxID=3038952 RepID=UPI00313DF035